ncbi:unnamed protein product [Cuscuta europaea]|uniref:VQ domain-containing protein n=1 Tax=Cuscuta europaea TaxID=41803 RepID=A0A9P1EG62_CUSEU|nr:unnamed protein product [Cuscuta europaea]
MEVKSPRKEIQGPRPTPLKVHKDSHKIRKPPPVPQPQHPPQAPPRPPVIIYTLSPKIIHANPSDFMSLVQRLTGSLPAEPSSSSQAFQGYLNGGAVSPAACFASLEKTRTTQKGKNPQLSSDVEGIVGGVEISGEVERSGFFPGVLSPTPASFPPIPPSFFSPPSDQNPLGFFTDLISPVLHSSRHYPETSFYITSPSILNNFISPRFIFSPGSTSLDLFSNDLFDLPATHTR